jgi:hypothetical protein
MPTLTFPIQADGLIVEVIITPSSIQIRQWQAQGVPIPRPLKVQGVMDTGADLTAVAPRVLQALGLPLSQTAHTSTAGGQVQVGVYEISLSILPATGSAPMFTDPHLLATELMNAAPGIEALVGLNIILQGVLHVDGPGGTFSFTF